MNKENLIEALGKLIADKPLLVRKRLTARGVKVPFNATNKKLVSLIVKKIEDQDQVFLKSIAKDLIAGGYIAKEESRYSYADPPKASISADPLSAVANALGGLFGFAKEITSKAGAGKDRALVREQEENKLMLAIMNRNIEAKRQASSGQRTMIWAIVAVFVVIVIFVMVIYIKRKGKTA